MATAQKNTVEIEVLALLADAKAQMASFGQSVTALNRQMGNSFDELGTRSSRSSREFSGFSDVMQRHVLEMRQEQSMTRNLAREFGALGLDAKGAGGAIAHLVSSFAVGGGLGLALGGVKLIAEAFKELSKGEEEARKAAEEWVKELRKATAESASELQKVIDKLNQVTPVQLVARQKAGIDQQIALTHEGITALEEQIASTKSRDVSLTGKWKVDELTAKLHGAREALIELEQQSKNLGQTGVAMQGVAVNEEMDARTKANAKAAADAADKARKDAEELAQAEYHMDSLRGDAAEEYAARTRKATDDRLAHERLAYYTQEAFGDQARGREIAALEAYYRDQIVAAEGNVDQQLALQRQFATEKQKILDQTAYDKSKTTAEDDWAKDWAEAIGTNFGHALGYMVLEAQSFSDAITGIFKSMAAAVIDQLSAIAAKWMTVQALTGIRGLLGPGGGDTDMGGAGVLLSASGGGGDWGSGSWFPGRASGGPVSFGRPYLIGESGPEVFVPGASGTVVPNDALAGAGVTQNFHFHGTLIDRRAVEGFARTYARDIAKGMRG